MEHLVIILDTPLDYLPVDHLLLFINSFLSLHPQNQVSTLFNGQWLLPKHVPNKPANYFKTFYTINQTIVHGIKVNPTKSQVTASLAKTLTYLNKHSSKTRVLILSGFPDMPHHYISFMNNIFSAQKMNVKIDVCRLVDNESIFLPQAAFITKGIYLVSKPQVLVHTLMQSLLCGAELRTHLVVGGEESIDFKAACFCHKQVISVGFVCSVCLSIFCEVQSECTTCKSRYA